MRAIHLLLAAALVGCSTSPTGLGTPTPAAYIEVQSPSPTPTPPPLMNGLPTTFAPCAGTADTVKEAAYNCLKDWKPAMEEYPGKVVYHFSPSITAAERRSIKKVTEFVLTRADAYLDLAGFAPEFHVFYNTDRPSVIRALLKSWPGTADIQWLYSPGGIGSLDGYGGNGIGSDIPRTTSAGISTPRSSQAWNNRYGVTQEWNTFDYYTYWVLPAEQRYGFLFSASETIFGNRSTYLDALPYWLIYVSGSAMGNAAGIQLLDATMEQYHLTLLSGQTRNGDRATWKPTISDPRFGPGLRWDLTSLNVEIPWRYDIQFLATQYITAMFGPDWVDQVLIPALLREPGKVNDFDVFRQKADRVAMKIWGGTWHEFEAAINAYVISELKAFGVIGLE